MKTITQSEMSNTTVIRLITLGVLGLFVLIAAFSSIRIVEPGHVGVKVTLGQVSYDELSEGVHVVWPLISSVTDISVKNQTHTFDDVPVPSQDQLVTKVDASVQWKVNPELAAEAFQRTGDLNKLVMVHIVPEFRSQLRSAGKSIVKAENFFDSTTQDNMQQSLLAKLKDSLHDKGVIIEMVLLRDFDLPEQVKQGVLEKKQREQEVERQRAEQMRFEIEQEQKVIQANAELDAARKEAEKITTLAQAEADALRIVGEMLNQYPKIVEYNFVENWDGVMPSVVSGSGDGSSLLIYPKIKE